MTPLRHKYPLSNRMKNSRPFRLPVPLTWLHYLPILQSQVGGSLEVNRNHRQRRRMHNTREVQWPRESFLFLSLLNYKQTLSYKAKRKRYRKAWSVLEVQTVWTTTRTPAERYKCDGKGEAGGNKAAGESMSKRWLPRKFLLPSERWFQPFPFQEGLSSLKFS